MAKVNEVDIFEEAGEKVEKQKAPKDFNLDHAIDDLVGNFCDPIVVWPSPWQDTLPKDLLEQVPLERLILQMRYNKGDIKQMTATDAEALIYMYPRTLEAPIGETWTQIYVWLGAQVCGRMGRQVPDDFNNVVLSRYQQDRLDELKRWIYHTRVNHRKEKTRDVRKAEKKAKEEESQTIQQAFDLFEDGGE